MKSCLWLMVIAAMFIVTGGDAHARKRCGKVRNSRGCGSYAVSNCHTGHYGGGCQTGGCQTGGCYTGGCGTVGYQSGGCYTGGCQTGGCQTGGCAPSTGWCQSVPQSTCSVPASCSGAPAQDYHGMHQAPPPPPDGEMPAEEKAPYEDAPGPDGA